MTTFFYRERLNTRATGKTVALFYEKEFNGREQDKKRNIKKQRANSGALTSNVDKFLDNFNIGNGKFTTFYIS